ncbi:MAG: TRAP-type C4-dicarboxylate transport system, small permease component, partial [uncultured Acetobacteraceae bacterium]
AAPAARHRPAQHRGRPDVRLVHPAADRRGRLRGLRALRVPRADDLGLRRVLHVVRHAVHDGGRLRAVAQRPRAGRLPVPQLPTAAAGLVRLGPLRAVLLPGDLRLHDLRLDLLRRQSAPERAQHVQPDRPGDLAVQVPHPRGGRAAAAARAGGGGALLAVHPRWRLAAAPLRRGRAGADNPRRGGRARPRGVGARDGAQRRDPRRTGRRPTGWQV